MDSCTLKCNNFMSAQYIYLLETLLYYIQIKFFSWNWSVEIILDISFHEVITGTLRKLFHWPGSRLGRFPQHRTWQILWQRRFLGFTCSPFLDLTWPSLLPIEWQVAAQLFSTALLCSSPRSQREGISSIRPSKSIDFVEQLEQKKNYQTIGLLD